MARAEQSLEAKAAEGHKAECLHPFVGNGAACPGAEPASREREQATSQDLTALQRELGLPLPEGARVLWGERENGMDDMVRAKFELSRSDFDSIADKLPIKLEQLTRGPGRLGSDHGAWNPRTTPGIRSAQTRLEGARYLGIGVAEGESGNVVLFVVNHGT